MEPSAAPVDSAAAGDIKVQDDEYSKALVVTRDWFDRTFREAFQSLVGVAEKREGARIEIDDDGVK